MEGAASKATNRALLRALVAIRAAQLLLFIPVLAGSMHQGYSRPGLVTVLYGAYVLWLSMVVALTLSRSRYDTTIAVPDVTVAIIVTVLLGLLMNPGMALGWSHWMVAPVIGTVMMVAAFRPWWQTWCAILALAAGYVASAWSDLSDAASMTAAVSNVLCMVVFSLITRLVTGLLRTSAQRADQATKETLMARMQEAETQARFEERTRQYRVLHDTVLSTLSIIARGGVDHRSVEIQERCASEADFLRGLIQGSTDLVPTSLGSALAQVGSEPAAFGVRVHQQFDNLPEDVPEPIIETISGAVREGLNNVVRHAGVHEAWLSASSDENGVITVTVTDNGIGFDPDTVTMGLGLRHSVRKRVEEIGGTVVVESNKDGGTTVELAWSP